MVTDEFCHLGKKCLFYTNLTKIEEKGILTSLFYEASVTLISKSDKTFQEITRNDKPISLGNIDAKFNTK